jgi:hypothetical protein
MDQSRLNQRARLNAGDGGAVDDGRPAGRIEAIGPGRPPPDGEVAPKVIKFDGTLRGKLAQKFYIEAQRRGRSPAELGADILETVIRDNLFAAVLDG